MGGYGGRLEGVCRWRGSRRFCTTLGGVSDGSRGEKTNLLGIAGECRKSCFNRVRKDQLERNSSNALSILRRGSSADSSQRLIENKKRVWHYQVDKSRV